MIFFQLFTHDPDVVRREAGDYLFRQGEMGEQMYVLVLGSAEILVGDRVVEIAAPGTILGERAVIESGPRSASVRATTDCEFVAIDKKRFQYLVSQTPHFAIEVMRVMADRLRAADAELVTE